MTRVWNLCSINAACNGRTPRAATTRGNNKTNTKRKQMGNPPTRPREPQREGATAPCASSRSIPTPRRTQEVLQTVNAMPVITLRIKPSGASSRAPTGLLGSFAGRFARRSTPSSTHHQRQRFGTERRRHRLSIPFSRPAVRRKWSWTRGSPITGVYVGPKPPPSPAGSTRQSTSNPQDPLPIPPPGPSRASTRSRIITNASLTRARSV